MSEFDGLSDRELRDIQANLLERFQRASRSASNYTGYKLGAKYDCAVAELGQTLIRLDEHAMYRNSERNNKPS